MFEGIKKNKDIILTALAVCIATLSGIFMPLSDDTYLHIGDAVVYAAAMLLPFKSAAAGSAVGAAFADILLGSYRYIIPTLIIKPLTVLAVVLLKRLVKAEVDRDFVICGAGAVTVIGYFVAETVIWLIAKRPFADAVSEAGAGMLFNVIQALAAMLVYLIIANSARKRHAWMQLSREEKKAIRAEKKAAKKDKKAETEDE